MIIATRKLQVRWPPVVVAASSSSSPSSAAPKTATATEANNRLTRKPSFRLRSMRSKINLFEEVATTAKLRQDSHRFNDGCGDNTTMRSTVSSTDDNAWLRKHSRISYCIRYNPFILKDTAMRKKRCKNDADWADDRAEDKGEDDEEQRARDGSHGYGRPDVWITSMEEDNDDGECSDPPSSRPRRKWIVKRVWDIEEKDAEEPQYEIEISDLAEGVQDLLGVPESERQRATNFSGESDPTENPLFTVQRVFDVEGVMVQDSETPQTTLLLDGGAGFAAQLERATADDATSSCNEYDTVSVIRKAVGIGGGGGGATSQEDDDDPEPSETPEPCSPSEGGADFSARLERERAAEAARGAYEVVCCGASFVSDLKEPSFRSLAGGASNCLDASFSGPASSAEEQRAILEEDEEDEDEEDEAEKPIGKPKKPVKLEKPETKYWWENPDSYKVPPSPSISVSSKQRRNPGEEEEKFRIGSNEEASQLGTIYSGENDSSEKKVKKKKKSKKEKKKKKKKKADEEDSTRKSIRKIRKKDGKNGKKEKKEKKSKKDKRSKKACDERKEPDMVIGKVNGKNEKKRIKYKKKVDRNAEDSSVSSTIIEEEELWSSWANDYWGMSPRSPKNSGVIKKEKEYSLNF